jgi:hypothetical protein
MVPMLTEQSKAISFTFMVKYSRSIFFLDLNDFMDEGRPAQPGKQFITMCKVVTFSNKSGGSIIPPRFIALSGI